MASNTLQTSYLWDAAGRYQVTAADAESGILLSNPNDRYTLYWASTSDATPPTQQYFEANPILPQTSQPMVPSEGTYIWVASERPMSVNLET